MANDNGEKAADSSVEKLCESMQKMLAQLMEQAQARLASVAVSVPEVIKFTLEPNPVKLTGPGDYFSWARNATLILGAHGLQKFLEEDEKKPADVPHEQMEQNQKRVMVWLLSSMENSVREQVENFQTAAEVWKSIELQFSGKSNKMQVSRILHEMRHIKQDQKTVTEYAGELKKLWRDLEFFRPFKAHDPRDVPLLKEWFEPLLVEAFLEGLNPDFKLHSHMIRASPDWPTLEQTISSILEEETRLANQTKVPHVNAETRATLSLHIPPKSMVIPGIDQANAMKLDYKRRTRVICDHCKKPGHIKKDCFDLVGYPPGWRQRQNNKFCNGNNYERRTNQAHLTASEREKRSETSQARALEDFKSMMMIANTEDATTSTSTGKGHEVGNNPRDWQ